MMTTMRARKLNVDPPELIFASQRVGREDIMACRIIMNTVSKKVW